MRLYDHKPIPSLSQFLEDAPKADGYYEYVAENIDLERALEEVGEGVEASRMRMLRIMAIAFTEICRTETETHGREIVEVIREMPRMAAFAVMGPIVSVMKEDASLRRVQKIITDEMVYGARQFVSLSNRASRPTTQERK
jgi:hypothetical protein